MSAGTEPKRVPGAEGCPEPDVLLGFVAHTLSVERSAQVEAHIASCEACRVAVSALAREAYATGATTTSLTPGDAPNGGRVLARGAALDRYLVLSLLGRGGMGEVYAAYDPELDRRIALKLLHTGGSTATARQRLMREARGLGRLSHPNVVQVYDVGEHDGDVFIAMELVEGQNLGEWSRHSPPPAWRDVLAAYLDAGRGLAAAHERGLVHRDVKPTNLVRGADGRVRVVDFGLVASAEGPPDGAPTDDGEKHPTAALTVAGALLGTPLYMAPEQFEQTRVGPAADQYALCASLYEALYRALPFDASPRASTRQALAPLLEQKRSGPPAAPPAASTLPPWVFKALQRGMNPRPEDRYPGIPELLAALSADPEVGRRRTRRRLATVAAVVAGAAVATAAWRGRPQASGCGDPAVELRGVWDEPLRAQVRAALLATGRPYAARSVDTTTASLDAYAKAWANMRAEVCQASLASGPLSTLLHAREACLDRRLSQLGALTRLLGAKPDVGTLDKAPLASAALPAVADCADVDALTSRVPPPEDPSVRPHVAALQGRLDDAETLYAVGRYKEALTLAASLLEEVKGVGYAPLLARVDYELGRARSQAGDDDGAKAILEEGAGLAAAAGDDLLVAEAWSQVLYVAGERQRHLDEARNLLAFGPTLVGRAHDTESEAGWLNCAGLALYRMGRYAEARAALERAVTLREARFGAEHPHVLQALNNLGLVLREVGKKGEAVALYERVLAGRERLLGPGHPAVASALCNLGAALFDEGELARAREVDQRAVSLRETLLGPTHRDVALPLNNLADVAFQTGEYAEAKRLHERALAIREAAFGPDHPDVAQSVSNLGLVDFELGDFDAARAEQARALAILEKALPPNHPDLAYPLVGLGRALLHLHDTRAARHALERALAVSKVEGHERARAEPLFGMGEVELAEHRPGAAAATLQAALEAGDAHLAGSVRLALAEALWQVGKERPRAVALAKAAQEAWEHIGHRPGAQRAARWLAAHPG